MFKKTLPVLILTLFIGLLSGCGSSNPYVDEAESSIKSQNFEAALEAAEQSITNQPNDPLGYYYKAVALGEIADTKDPEKRQKYYERMNEAFAQAKELAAKMEDPPSEIERISAVRNTIWSQEHNRAISLATDDSLKKVTENPLEKSIAHLNNATTVQPDSALSWDVKSQVYYMNNNVEGAIRAMEHYIKIKPNPTAEDYVRLAQYYRIAEKPQEAIRILETAQQKYPENRDIATNLADSYTTVGRTQKAISTLETLIEKEPENPQFHLVLGTQIYKTVIGLSDSVSTNNDRIFELQQQLNDASGEKAKQIKQQITKLEEANAQLQSRIDRLTEQAEKELKTVIEYRPNDATAYNTLGIIYQNKASALFEKRNRTTDNEKAAAIDKKAKEVLRQAMKYYEKATAIDPDNKDYWANLFRVYTSLGMDQKAQEAMKKAGLDDSN